MAAMYCFLCGANAQVAGALEAEIAHAFSQARPDAPPPPTSSIFHFLPEDIKWQEKLCLLGPLDEQHAELFEMHETSPAAVEAIDVRSVRLLRPMIPGENHDYGTVASPAGREYNVTGNVFPFFHAGCFKIFQTVCAQSGRESWAHPERVLWAVIRRQNLDDPDVSGINGINYGLEIENTQGIRTVEPLANLKIAGIEGLTEPVVRCLELNKHQLVPFSVYRSWWFGPAALWIFKRPDIFPVEEAYINPFHMIPLPPSVSGVSPLERLPVELLALIVEELDRFTDLTSLLCLSKSVRHLCVKSMGIFVRTLAPGWLIPPPRVLHQLKLDPQWPPGPFPWLRYAHWCRFNSPSMRNRWRIFGVCQQIVDIAMQMDDDALGQPQQFADFDVEE